MTESTDALPVTCTPETTPDVPRLYALGDLLAEWAADAEAAHAACLSGTPRGPVTGFPALDRELGGYLAPGLHIVHGPPGAGKTALALQVAAQCGAPALFVTTEMAPLELLRRLTARVTRTYLGRLKSGEYTPAASLELAAKAAGACPMLALMDATRAYVAPWKVNGEPAGILEAAELWRERHAAASCLVVVDSLHTWADAGPYPVSTEYERLNAAIGELKRLATRLGAPVLAIAEQRRDAMGTGAQSAGAGTRKIEYTGESVLALMVDEDRQTDAAGEYAITAKYGKNRNGAAGRKVELRFQGALQAFREA